MAQTYAQYINCQMDWLVNYINHIVDFNNSYNKAIMDLCFKSNVDNITKSEEIIQYEKEMKSAYDRAMELYKDLERIIQHYKWGMNIDYEIQAFNNRLQMTRFPIFEKTTLILESLQNSDIGIPTGAAAPVLEGGISKSDLDIEKEELEKNVKNWEKMIKLNKTPFFAKPISKILQWRNPDAVGMMNIASGKYLPLYTKDAIRIKNISDNKFDKFRKGDLSKFRLYMAAKISDQFKDFNYDLDDVNGYIFKNNSAVVKRIKNSEEFKNILLKHKEDIINNENFSGRFSTDYNLHNAFGSIDFLNGGLDKKGNLHLYMFDTYDFNKGENAKVEAGRRQMLKGNLKGFFSVHEIVIKKKDLEKYGLQSIE